MVRKKVKSFGIAFRLDNVTHEDWVAGIGNDEEQEWMIDINTWAHAIVYNFHCRDGCRFSAFFVNLRTKKTVYSEIALSW